MRGLEPRRLLILESDRTSYRLRLLQADAERLLLGGEALCQAILQDDPESLVIARGPMPFLSGNKTTVGYISPLTGLPHYSFVGGRAFAELLNLGLDAIVLSGDSKTNDYVVVSGRAPHLTVEWKSSEDLPEGQRAAFYWLLEHELEGQSERGSIFSIGEGARLGYRSANLGVDGLYHAGRGGAGGVFARFVVAMVLCGTPLTWDQALGPRADAFWELREGELRERLETYTQRLARRDGGTVTKLWTTGSGERPTLPSRNAQQLGYKLADLGERKVLQASRSGQTGCHWCQVNCRHWHWVNASYAPGGRDRFLDDFETIYAVYAMLDLQPAEDSTQGRLRLLDEVDRRVIQPIEQMGCDVIDVGLALAALFEGLEQGLVPLQDVPSFLRTGPYLGQLSAVSRTVQALRLGDPFPALWTVGHGPQALAERYPDLQKILFTSGPGTLGNAGHANSLWTFLMPFSRFFGHYVSQLYKIEGQLPPATEREQVQSLFERVIGQALQNEFYSCLCNSLSMCAFTFVLFSRNGEGRTLADAPPESAHRGELLVRTLASYGIETNREELEWHAESFWARSMAFKMECGWRPPQATDYPYRVFEVLSKSLDRPVSELWELMDLLISEWRRQAGEVLYKYGYEVPNGWL